MYEQKVDNPTSATPPHIPQDNAEQFNPDVLRTRADWKALGYCVPTKSQPVKTEAYQVPGSRTVFRDRHLFGFSQVYEIRPEESARRSEAATKGKWTREANMRRAMETVDLTIIRGKTTAEIHKLARSSHGGNYMGNPGEFIWSNRTAQNTIRHALTNYEAQWGKINRGWTGQWAYQILRNRVDRLVDEAYPEYANGMPELGYSTYKETDTRHNQPHMVLNPDHRADYYDREELVNRGWTRKWRRILGAADVWTVATKLAIGHPLWRCSRVENMEATQEWRSDRRAADRAGS
jgi:hypothetical protein